MAELDVSLDELLFNERRGADRADVTASQARPIQRGNDRHRIRLASGVLWERLTTVSEPGVEFLYVIYEVGGASSPDDTFQRHSGHEWGYVISGELKVTIGFRDHVLEPGRLDLTRLVDAAPPGEHGRHAGPRHLVRHGPGRGARMTPSSVTRYATTEDGHRWHIYRVVT